MSRVQVPSLTPSEGAPDLRKRRSGAPSLPALPPCLGLFRGRSLGSQRGLLRPCAAPKEEKGQVIDVSRFLALRQRVATWNRRSRGHFLLGVGLPGSTG